MRVLQTKWFARFARRQRISDQDLIACIERIEAGHIDADLGGGLLKQRVGRPGRGRSGGFRMIIVFRLGDLACFVYGFAKKERTNIDADELATFKAYAVDLLAISEADVSDMLDDGRLIEVQRDA